MLSEFPQPTNRLTLNKAILWLLWGGFAVLIADIRVEHNQVLQTWQAWIPIICCGFMLIAIPIAIALWHRGGRQVLLASFLSSAAVGIIGLSFHMKSILGPVCFIGIGLIGAASCLRLPAEKAGTYYVRTTLGRDSVLH